CSTSGEDDGSQEDRTTTTAVDEETTTTTDEGDDNGDDNGNGPDVGGGGSDAYVAALVEGFSIVDEEGIPLDNADVQCFAQNFVDLVGADNYAAAGYEPQDLQMAGPFPSDVDLGSIT